MVVLITKKMIVVFVLVLATVVVSSNAAQRARFVTVVAASHDIENRYQGISTKISEEGVTVNRVHARMMEMMNADDYGRHDPSPSLAKPRYKLIPN